MAEKIDNNKTVGWDDEISEEQVNSGREGRDAFVTLPAGEYKFTVNKMERGSFPGSKNLPPCNMVKVGVIVDGGEKGRSYITTNFFMVQKCLWTIYEFLTSVGLHKKGDGASPIPWSKVEQGLNELNGTCKISIRTYKNKKQDEVQQNEVKTWLAPPNEQPSLDDMPF